MDDKNRFLNRAISKLRTFKVNTPYAICYGISVDGNFMGLDNKVFKTNDDYNKFVTSIEDKLADSHPVFYTIYGTNKDRLLRMGLIESKITLNDSYKIHPLFYEQYYDKEPALKKALVIQWLLEHVQNASWGKAYRDVKLLMYPNGNGYYMYLAYPRKNKDQDRWLNWQKTNYTKDGENYNDLYSAQRQNFLGNIWLRDKLKNLYEREKALANGDKNAPCKILPDCLKVQDVYDAVSNLNDDQSSDSWKVDYNSTFEQYSVDELIRMLNGETIKDKYDCLGLNGEVLFSSESEEEALLYTEEHLEVYSVVQGDKTIWTKPEEEIDSEFVVDDEENPADEDGEDLEVVEDNPEGRWVVRIDVDGNQLYYKGGDANGNADENCWTENNEEALVFATEQALRDEINGRWDELFGVANTQTNWGRYLTVLNLDNPNPQVEQPQGPIVEVVANQGRLRVRGNDGVHGDKWCVFPANLREREGQRFRVVALNYVTGRDCYTVTGPITEVTD